MTVILTGLTLAVQTAQAAPPARRASAAKVRVANARPVQNDPRSVRDPFAPVPVTTTDALVRLVRTNRKVRGLYARHFGVSEARITDSIANALSLQRLPRSRTFLNYCARPNGTIYAVRTRISAGELVWATRSGEPMLKWICSNPLTKTLPGTRLPVAARAVPARPQTTGTLTPEDEPLGTTSSLAQEPVEVAGLAGSVSDAVASVPIAALPPTGSSLSGSGIASVASADQIVWTTSLSSAPTAGPSGAANPFGVASGTPINLPRVAAAVTAAAPLVSTLTKNGTSPVTVVPTEFAPTVTATIPEPGSLLFIGAAFPVLWRVRRA